MFRALPVVARRAPVQLAVRGKKTTGIVGLAVETNAKPILLDLYAQTLVALEGVPATSEYRKTVEGLTKERMAAVQKTDNLVAIEEAIGGGQVEQLIEQAKDELSLIPTLISARAFDAYDGSPPEEILTDLKRYACAARHCTAPHRMEPPPSPLPSPLSSAALCPRSGVPVSLARSLTPSLPPPLFHRRRGVALQRDDIPMRPSVDFPTESEVELELPAPPEEKEEAK